MLTLTKTSSDTKLNTTVDVQDSQQAYFLQEVLENLQDGILILSANGDILHANSSARGICLQLNESYSEANVVPASIWQLCESLIENHRALLPTQQAIVSDEIVVDKSNVFRVRVRWLDLIKFQTPCLLVTIENRYESLKNVAIAEVKKYDLTPRESEIWLLYRANHSYKEIAESLYISLNTVKKHMKSIHSKRHAYN
ncbi:MAG: helix-turn-helix transcriptional regulator [Scytonematopsis contorta HA4267-MV1]|jgi:DNA-binding CsgD family transcriptional regulator|nr:helix-turn-helix transcriptional regulator [Scytonematopsis contorta HA4267-MV1]